jgi:DNA-binding NarL/FixJ family response regulator
VDQIGALIVDDQADVRRLIRLIIEDANHELFVSGEAATAHDAISAAGELKPSVVLMDYMMPEMDGVSCARQILSARPEQAVILCTAFLDEALQTRAREAGIRACLSKTEFHRIPEAMRAALA